LSRLQNFNVPKEGFESRENGYPAGVTKEDEGRPDTESNAVLEMAQSGNQGILLAITWDWWRGEGAQATRKDLHVNMRRSKPAHGLRTRKKSNIARQGTDGATQRGDPCHKKKHRPLEQSTTIEKWKTGVTPAKGCFSAKDRKDRRGKVK